MVVGGAAPATLEEGKVPGKSPPGNSPLIGWSWQRLQGFEVPGSARTTSFDAAAEEDTVRRRISADACVSKALEEEDGENRHGAPRLSSSAPSESRAGWMRLPFSPGSLPGMQQLVSESKVQHRQLPSEVGGAASGSWRGAAFATVGTVARAEAQGWGFFRTLPSLGSGRGSSAHDKAHKIPDEVARDLTATLKWGSVARGRSLSLCLGGP